MSIRILKKKWLHYLENEPDLRLSGFFARVQSAINHLEIIKPDLIIINLSLPSLLGINPTQIISQFGVNRQIIFLTLKDNSRELERILQGGARAYLLNSTKIPEIINVIRLVDKGYFYLDSQLAQKYIFQISEKPWEQTSKKPAKTAKLFDRDLFFVELQAIHHESKSIKLILKKLVNRLFFLPKILEVLILIILLLVLAIILIVE